MDRCFIQVKAGETRDYDDDHDDYDVYFEYEKVREKDWKIVVDYNHQTLVIEIKKVSE